MSPQLIIALIISLCSFGGGWVVQGWRYDAKEKDYAEQQLVQARATAADDLHRAQAVLDAQNQAVQRQRRLTADADVLRGAVVGLSDAENRALRTARDSQDTCLVAATAFRELFDASVEEYRRLAEKAGRHASDVQTLTDAWPQK